MIEAPARERLVALAAGRTAGSLPWRAPWWWAAVAAAAAASLVVVQSSGASLAIVIPVGIAGSALLALLPFRWLVIAMILASGLTSVQVAVAPVNLRPDIMFVPAVLISCLVHGRRDDLLHWARHPVVVLLGAFVALQYVVSVLAAPDPARSVSVATWMLLNLFVVVLTLVCFGDDRRTLLRWLTVTAFVIVASGCIGWLLAKGFGVALGATTAGQDVRANGIALEPNILAGTAAIWAVIILTSARRLRTFDYAFLLLCLLAIPLSVTRAAAIALAAGIALYIALNPRNISRVAVVALIAVAALVLIQAVAPSQSTSLSQKLVNYGDQTATERFSSWEVAIGDLSGPGWLFGLGTNSYGQRHLEPTLLPARVPAYLGNLPLQTLYDSGLLGLGLLATAGLLLVRTGDRKRRLAVMVTFIAISSATSPFFFGNWWLFIALALAQDGVPAVRSTGAP